MDQGFTRPLKILSKLALIGLVMLLLVKVASFLPLFDYLEYWSAGWLNRSGGNPYGYSELYNLQQGMGWKYNEPLFAWTPPWSLSVMMLLSYLPYQLSRAFWLLFSVLAVLIAAGKTWQVYGGDSKLGKLALAAGILFSPVFYNLLLGQITSLILLGIVGFLVYSEHENKSPWSGIIAGVSLSTIAIKPQLLYLVFVALLLWSVARRSWMIFLGFTLSILLTSTFAWIFNHAVFQQYLTALQQYPPNYWATPTLGYYLRKWFGLKHFWLQFLPAIPGLAWLGYYWVRNRSGWRWKADLPIILMVSLLTSSYTWVHDQIILVPVIVLILLWINHSKLTHLSTTILLLLCATSLAYFVLHFIWDDSVFAWISPLLLLLFLPAHLCLKRRFNPA